MYIEISNKGEIDTNGLHLMGVSDKRGQEKIGFFGSGNKYSMALLLRENIPFKIFSGTSEIKIETEPVMFRGQLFEQIVVDGQKTSLTTSMGPDWETWFAIREIYCNAVDEGEEILRVTKEIKPQKGRTYVYIELTPELGEFFKNIKSYILTNHKPIDSVDTHYGKIELIDKMNNCFVCYRKNIRIYPENERDCLYWYNFSNIEINESRTYKYEYQIKEQIASFFTVTNNREVILNLLNNWRGKFEGSLYWRSVYDSFSEEWHKILKGKRIYPEGVAMQSGDFEGKLNSFIVPDDLAEKIGEEIGGCEVVGYSQNHNYEIVKPDNETKEKVERAIEELREIGYLITSPIEYAVPYIDDVVAWYDKKIDTIFLTVKYLTTIDKIKNTLLEEHFHSKGFVDGNRSFTTFLIDEIIRFGKKQRTKREL